MKKTPRVGWKTKLVLCRTGEDLDLLLLGSANEVGGNSVPVLVNEKEEQKLQAITLGILNMAKWLLKYLQFPNFSTAMSMTQKKLLQKRFY